MNAEQENKDREMLIRLQERVGFYLERQDKFITEILTRLTAIEEGKASEQVQKDHESRIRRLESLGSKAIGAIGLIQLIGFGIIFNFLK